MWLKTRAYTIYSITTTILWEAVLAAVVLLLLPKLQINIPVVGLIILMAVLAMYAYAAYRLGSKALRKRPVVSLEAMIGRKCKSTTPLSPKGYIRLRGELWPAKSSSVVNANEEVIVKDVEELTFVVGPADSDNQETKKLRFKEN